MGEENLYIFCPSLYKREVRRVFTQRSFPLYKGGTKGGFCTLNSSPSMGEVRASPVHSEPFRVNPYLIRVEGENNGLYHCSSETLVFG